MACFGSQERLCYSGGRGSKERGVLSRICWGSAACGQGPRTCVGVGREACGGTGERCGGDQGFYIPHDIGEKEKWQTTSVFGSAEAQRGDSLQEISDGGNKALEDYAAKRGLSYIGGPERRVLACTGGEGVSKVATVPVSRATLPFSLPSVRFGVGSEDFLKNSQTGGGTLPGKGDPVDGLLRRFDHRGGNSGRMSGQHGVRSRAAGDVGLGHQCGEVSFSPLQDHRLSRLYGGHRVDAVVGYQRETEKLPWILQKIGKDSTTGKGSSAAPHDGGNIFFKLQSLSQAVPYAALHLQRLTQEVRRHTEGKLPLLVRWDMLVKPDQGVVHELMWWDSFLKAWKVNAIMGTDASYQVYSDASDCG